LGNDSFELKMESTRIGIRDSDLFYEWTVPFPGGNKYKGAIQHLKFIPILKLK